jgi:hypothetical protein
MNKRLFVTETDNDLELLGNIFYIRGSPNVNLCRFSNKIGLVVPNFPNF